ncbi:MAG: hypothetical protein K2H51_01210 [Malacoplasma sp.]|nr:hypothetical protein [Malacoplasma sp.]
MFLKNYISPFYKQMKDLSEKEKKDLGQKLNELKEKIEKLLLKELIK